MSKKIGVVLPPPVPTAPEGLGTAAATTNPFEVAPGTPLLTDEYATLPPIIATVMRDTDRMAERIEQACDEKLVKENPIALSSLGRTYQHLQRVKLKALDTLVSTSESAVAQNLMRAQTVAVETQTKNMSNGAALSSPQVRELLDLIARRTTPAALGLEG